MTGPISKLTSRQTWTIPFYFFGHLIKLQHILYDIYWLILRSLTSCSFGQHQGRIGLPQEAEDVLLRVDFVREVDELLQEVRAEQSGAQMVQSRDPESIAVRMKHEEKQRTIRQVEALLDLAMTLEW